MESEFVLHNDGCHCKKVRWKVQASISVIAWKCNCFDFSITTYISRTHTAKHTFSKFCGITSFYTPRSNLDGIVVTLACLDPRTLSHVEIRNFD
ncbi:hypothetical protein Gotri_027689, partial [Gossypium trilobum]|nr:hypothetical protein [Gossypium trilobum]